MRFDRLSRKNPRSNSAPIHFSKGVIYNHILIYNETIFSRIILVRYLQILKLTNICGKRFQETNMICESITTTLDREVPVIAAMIGPWI